MTEHVHTVDCFVEGVQVCGMELARHAATSQHQLANDVDQVRGALELCEPEEGAAFERILKTLGHSQPTAADLFPRQVRGNFFPKLPLLTDKQDCEARAGACPTCHNHTLMDMGAGEGLRFMGCCACLAVVVLASRPEDRLIMTTQGRRHGRAHLAQQVGLVMRKHQELEDQANGHCTRGVMCICHDSMPAVRFECRNWRKA